MRDIKNKQDIALLVNTFYERVQSDPCIGYLFNEVAHVDWSKHLPKMIDFWDSILFQSGSYSGNPMPVHQQLHEKSALTAAHFDQWKKLFIDTVNILFEGENATRAIHRARSIATIMQIKVLHLGE